MTLNFTFFADESGQSGSNYLDIGQPFHVAAGWLVDPTKESEVASTIARSSGPEHGEVKGRDLINTERGRKKLAVALRELREHATPFFVAYERRFSATAKIVSVYFDSYTNPDANWIVPGDAVRERDVAEHLARLLPPAVIERFAQHYRCPSKEGLGASAQEIERVLAARGSSLAATLQGAIKNIEAIAAEEHHGNQHRAMAGLNVPALSQLMRKVDRFMDRNAPARWNLVHDEMRECESSFVQAVRILGSAARATEVPLSGGVSRRLHLGHYDSMRMAHSESTPGVQAADFLAVTVRKLFNELSSGQNLHGARRKLCKHTLSHMLIGDDPELGGVFMPREDLDRLAPIILGCT